MHASKQVLVLIAFTFFASATSAEIGDGKWFLETCSPDSLKKIENESKDRDKVRSQIAYCSAFVMGIVHGHYASRSAYSREPLFCAPGRSYLEIMGDIFAIIQSQPERRDLYAATLALQGLARMYPCKN